MDSGPGLKWRLWSDARDLTWVQAMKDPEDWVCLGSHSVLGDLGHWMCQGLEDLGDQRRRGLKWASGVVHGMGSVAGGNAAAEIY